MKLRLKVWRQRDGEAEGRFVDYLVENASVDMSFLEMLDVLNDQLVKKGEEAIAFDHDCREGICGSCGFMINGLAHGGKPRTTVCQLHLRSFKDGETLVLEPWRAKAFPVIKDLMVNRSAFDRIIQAGGYISVNTGNAPDGNAIPIQKEMASEAFDSATCIGCGACVASCKNASAMLFTSAKVTQLSLLPQGQLESVDRVQSMVAQMDAENFGACTNEAECSAACPKGIPFKNITHMNAEYIKAQFKASRTTGAGGE